MQGKSTQRKRMSGPKRREVIERAATEVFAQHGYTGASMNEIAKRSGVSVPVVYDHFPSKKALYRHLLEKHFAQLRASWRTQFLEERPLGRRVANALDAFFGFVETHPAVWQMLFGDTSGEADVIAIRKAVEMDSWAMVLEILPQRLGAEKFAGDDEESLEMAVEIVRTGLQGLAQWWLAHPHIPRERVVAAAMNTIWVGFARIETGETWSV